MGIRSGPNACREEPGEAGGWASMDLVRDDPCSSPRPSSRTNSTRPHGPRPHPQAGGATSESPHSAVINLCGVRPNPGWKEGCSSGGNDACPAQGRADLLDGLEACLRPLRQALPAEGVAGLVEAGTEACERDDRRRGFPKAGDPPGGASRGSSKRSRVGLGSPATFVRTSPVRHRLLQLVIHAADQSGRGRRARHHQLLRRRLGMLLAYG